MGVKVTKPAKRLVRTLIAREAASSGRTAATRKTINTTVSSVSIPDKINWVVVKNTGSQIMAFNFGSDGATDFYSLAPNEVSPRIGLGEGVTINARTLSGTTTIECIFWG